MSNEYDLIVIGGGCAGLSLSTELIRYGNAAPRTLVLDSRVSYSNDRTWCFWQLPETASLDLVQFRWPRFRVATREWDVVVNCANTPYCAIPADQFYAYSLKAIERSAKIAFAGKAPVTGPLRLAGGRWEVATPGATYTARNVVDTRPVRAPRRGDAVLWQSFLGAEVTVDRGCFNTDEVSLMDFRETPRGRMLFTYVLPFSPTRGLVEVTEFSSLASHPAELQPFLSDALQRVTQGVQFRTLRTEAGMLPMGGTATPGAGAASDGEGASYVQAGVAGGGARACTGYAFQRIQRWAGQCAAHLVENERPLGHPKDSSVMTLLDHLFLRVLRDHPDLAPGLFVRLFAGAPTGAVLRFLGDRSNAIDVMRVIAALPPGPFIKQLALLCAEPASSWRESFVS